MRGPRQSSWAASCFQGIMKYFFAALTLTICLMAPNVLLAQTSKPAIESDPVAIVGGQPVTEQEVLDAIGQQQLMQLRNQQYDVESKALEGLIKLKVVQAEAKKRGMTPEALVALEVDSKVADPPDSEVEAFFWGQNRVGVRFEDVKDQFRSALKTLKIQKARSIYAESLRKSIDVRVMLRPPAIEVAYDSARVKGDANAPVTIVEFSDFQCPFCKQAESTLQAILAKYGSKVRLAFMDFPLREIHPRAQGAAEAARCAGEQGKFWEYHDVLYADQTKLDGPALIASARALKLDETAFQACLASGKFKSQIDADLAEGQKAGVSGTPGFFINGVFLSGSQPQVEFEKAIDTQLALSN